MKKEYIMVIGGYGHVGQKICTQLGEKYGIDYVDISADFSFLSQVKELHHEAVRKQVTAILSVGLAPGVTNLLARYAKEQMDRMNVLDITIMLGLGDAHGKAAIEWTIDNLNTDFDVVKNGSRYGELRQCTFHKCRFRGTQMDEIMTTGCQFTHCDFSGAVMNASIHTNSAFTNCRFQHANLFIAKFEQCKMVGSDFAGTQLGGVTISGGDWSYTNLRNADLSKQNLRGIRFCEADLYGCNLEKADLRNVDLTRCQMGKVRLQQADLRGATMSGVDFTSVDIKGVRIDMNLAVEFARSYGAKIE